MVKFRNLISKTKSPEADKALPSQADGTQTDRFSFSHMALKDQAAGEEHQATQQNNGITRNISSAVSPETKPIKSSSELRFKEIYPSNGIATPLPPSPANHLELRQPPETEPTDPSRPVYDSTMASFSEKSGVKKSYAITELSPEVEEDRKQLYGRIADYLAAVLNAVRRRRKFSLATGFQIMHQMVETQPPYDPLFVYAIHQDHPGEFVVYHSVNVSIFAIKMAQYLGFSKQRQEEIGMAGLLHDVGMGLISEDILFKDGKLNKKEIALFRERPVNSYKILKAVGSQYPYLAESAYQVYERIDGTGYPNGLQADQICEYAQIIGLVSIYEALIHSRPQREKFLHFSAVKEIMKRDKKGFQKKHLKALLNIFSIFPLSSYVRLNSNAVGKVIETYPDYPMRPKLQIVCDSENQRVFTDRVVDLSENFLLYIVDAVSDEDLKGLAIT